MNKARMWLARLLTTWAGALWPDDTPVEARLGGLTFTADVQYLGRGKPNSPPLTADEVAEAQRLWRAANPVLMCGCPVVDGSPVHRRGCASASLATQATRARSAQPSASTPKDGGGFLPCPECGYRGTMVKAGKSVKWHWAWCSQRTEELAAEPEKPQATDGGRSDECNCRYAERVAWTATSPMDVNRGPSPYGRLHYRGCPAAPDYVPPEKPHRLSRPPLANPYPDQNPRWMR